jgi:hypothetical protein
MDDVLRLRAAVNGLLRFAATEEELLLATAGHGPNPDDGPGRWSAGAIVAHNTEFKAQQVRRLTAILDREEPPHFDEVDHASPQVYASYAAQAPDVVASDARRVAADLVDGLAALQDADLTDASRHEWLRGRHLWLQVVVRGFWHPTGHVGDYYIDHGDPGRALALHEHAVRYADHLGVPDPARAMARYSLGCAQARAGRADEAVAVLTFAVALNPGLRANVERDRDLAALRDGGRLDRVRAMA